jgi:transposase
MTQTIRAKLTRNALYVALELSSSTWKLGFSTGGPVKVRTIEAGDPSALLEEIARARVHAEVDVADVVACYEAGRDGFWIQRLLASQGIACIVVDPSSIQVDRRARRRKTDRIDVTRLCIQLARWHAGDQDALHVAVIPSEDEEDARRRERELSALKKERARHSARIKGLVALHGVSLTPDKRLNGAITVEDLRQWNGSPLPPQLLAEVNRELKRLALTEEQIRVIEGERRKDVKRCESKEAEKVTTLTKLRGVADGSAWTLVLEAFSWRKFANRRQLAAYAGLDPSPFASGDVDRGPGISKAGNERIRTMMIELAWSWLRFQPDSALSVWFNERFAEGKRTRRIGIVALARKLLIAFWRYLEEGVVPGGAMLKS